MKKIFSTITVITVMMLSITVTSCGDRTTDPDSILAGIDLDGVYNLMIVAHPDDESLWGGVYLLRYDFFVVVLTHGGDDELGLYTARPHQGFPNYSAQRRFELYNAMNFANTPFLALDYADVSGGFDCRRCMNNLAKDIRTIIGFKDWERIVTHNLTGDSGHRHHIVTNQIVTDIAVELGFKENLYYFNTVYGNDVRSLTDCELKWVYELLSHFTSQMGVVDFFRHHMPYQQIVRAF